MCDTGSFSSHGPQGGAYWPNLEIQQWGINDATVDVMAEAAVAHLRG